MKNIKKNQRGFTLIEILLYIALFVIFISIIMSMFTTVMESYGRSFSESSIQQDSQYIIERLSYDIHRADSIVTPASIGGTGNSLVLQINGQNYSYTLSNGQLTLSDGINAFFVNSDLSSINTITFTRIGNPLGKHTIKAEFNIISNRELVGESKSETYTTTFGTR